VSAERTSRAAEAAEQLCQALWEALHEQLRIGSAEQVATLADQIADVSRSVSALVRLTPEREESDRTRIREQAPIGAEESEGARAGGTQALGDVEHAAAVIVDEQSEALDAPIAIRDERRGAQGTPWGTVVQRGIDRYLVDREHFAVLLVELLDAERLRLAQSPIDAERQIREVEAAMVQELRPADALVREAHGRYWLVAPATDAPVARALASRIAAAARRSASHRGVPLEVAAGIAFCPEHGVEVGSLLGHAEVDLYAAEAGGTVSSDPDGDPAA
jgi:GGDEF domain-containing protein